MGGRRGEIDVISIGFHGELKGFYYTIHVVLIMGKISDILAGASANQVVIIIFQLKQHVLLRSTWLEKLLHNISLTTAHLGEKQHHPCPINGYGGCLTLFSKHVGGGGKYEQIHAVPESSGMRNNIPVLCLAAVR